METSNIHEANIDTIDAASIKAAADLKTFILNKYMKRIFPLAIFVFGGIQFVLGQTSTDISSDEQTASIERLVVSRIEVLKMTKGMAVGIIANGKTSVITHGVTGRGDERAIDVNTIFEIGGLTRVFTLLMLADMVSKGKISFDDDINKYLPKDGRIQSNSEHPVTILDLALHTSTLPFLPDDVDASDPASMVDYYDEQLLNFLAHFKQAKASKNREWRNSDLGIGLLGIIMCKASGLTYRQLLQKSICEPLQLRSTSIDISPKNLLNAAIGHDRELKVAPNWIFPALKAANALHSSLADLLIVLDAFIRMEGPLSPAIKLTMETTFSTPQINEALGWWLTSLNPAERVLAFAGGNTWGFSSFMILDRKRGFGVVILSNSVNDYNELAWEILNPK